MKVPNIKFNLKFYTVEGREIVIRTFDDLVANLNLSELWDYYKSGILARWLRSIGKVDIANDIVKMPSYGSLSQQVEAFLGVLGIDVGSGAQREFVDLLAFQKKMSANGNKDNKNSGSIKREVELFGHRRDGGTGSFEVEPYSQLVEKLLDNPDDFMTVRGVVGKLIDQYWQRFERDILTFIDYVPVLKFVILSRSSWTLMLHVSVSLAEKNRIDIYCSDKIANDYYKGIYVRSGFAYSIKVSDDEYSKYLEWRNDKPSKNERVVYGFNGSYGRLVLKPEWR